MSTLGRKAMKKTLEGLKQDALGITRLCLNNFVRVLNDYDNMSKAEQHLFNFLTPTTLESIVRVLRYVQALEDYGYELDEEWDKLLKRAEAQQSKPMQKKDEAKKTPYIK